MLVKKVSRKKSHGKYVYGCVLGLPREWIGEKVYVLHESEYHAFYDELKRLRVLKSIFENIANCKGRKKRMFSVVTETWNPITGCFHGCRYCWAMSRARRLKRIDRYRNGFVPNLNEKELSKRFNGGLVFVSDMGDMWGEWVLSDWIRRVLDHIRKYPDTLFLFMTKNPARYYEFIDEMPENTILGATIETNRDDMYLEKNISKAPLPSRRYHSMKDLDWDKKFISIEPILDFDLDIFVDWIKDIKPFMVYVGYDNYNNKLPEPPLRKTEELIKTLSNFTAIVKKTLRPAWFEGLGRYLEK